MPPLADKGIVDLSAFQDGQFEESTPEKEASYPWPDFIARVELEVRWQEGPEPEGILRVISRLESPPAFILSLVPETSDSPGAPLLAWAEEKREGGRVFNVPINARALRCVLTSRAVLITWQAPAVSVQFPVNLDEQSKASLPSVLGERPDEQQLLAYFHGRISEEELIELLERQAAEAVVVGHSPTAEEAERLRKLQSYLLRDFVESLFGLDDMLRQSMRSPRAFELALLGDFSPISLAEKILQALRAGQRSVTAAAFQFVELLRVVAVVRPEASEPLSPQSRICWKKFAHAAWLACFR